VLTFKVDDIKLKPQPWFRRILNGKDTTESLEQPRQVPQSIVRQGKLQFLILTIRHLRQIKELTLVVDAAPQGYPSLAAFLDSDENFMVFRRFGHLHTRLLLQKQDELRIMERDLETIDNKDSRDNPDILQCREDDAAQTSQNRRETRTELFRRIKDTLVDYGNCFLNPDTLNRK
jgi:hypothetical protein